MFNNLSYASHVSSTQFKRGIFLKNGGNGLGEEGGGGGRGGEGEVGGRWGGRGGREVGEI